MQSNFDGPSLRLPVAVEQASLQSVEVVDWILDEVIAKAPLAIARAFAFASLKDEGPEASSRHRANHWPGAILITQATAFVVR